MMRGGSIVRLEATRSHDDEIRGELALLGATALYSVDPLEDRTMMQSYASTTSSGAAGPF
jgi:hypothetical protein